MFVKLAIIIILLRPTIQAQWKVHFEWSYINYTWPSPEAYNQAVKDGSYVKEHNVVSGIKIWKDRMYLAVPRLRNGVPATLTSTSIHQDNGTVSPLLEPFPSWEMNEIGDCSALQFVQSMEIDLKGRMWVINNGRIEVRADKPKSLCPTKLMIFDLENDGELLLEYTFPQGVIRSKSVYLNDLVLDHEDGGFAYITDNDKEHPGIVVFSLKTKRSWKIFHRTMLLDPKATDIVVNGTKLSPKSNVDGIALSPASEEGINRMLYYSPLSSFETFALPTYVLKTGRSRVLEDRYVRVLGRKPSQSDGMMMSATGFLFFGYLARHTVCYWNHRDPEFTERQKVLTTNPKKLEWPDSFDIDQAGNLWNTAKKQSAIRSSNMDMTQKNFMIIRTKISMKKYLFYENGEMPVLPVIEEPPLVRKLIENLTQAFDQLRQRILMQS